MFRAAFNHVKDAVEDVYKAMTRSSPAGHGGTAALQLDNELEPFECAWCSRVSALYLPLTCVAVPSAGVRYTAIPPAKKFREMALMSSGEKAVATLALLFAIHRYGLHYDTAVHGCAWLCLSLTHAALWFVCSYKRAPFFILDEIDANLDKFNVQKVVNYVRTRTAPTDDHPDNAEVQCLVISLKVCLRFAPCVCVCVCMAACVWLHVCMAACVWLCVAVWLCGCLWPWLRSLLTAVVASHTSTSTRIRWSGYARTKAMLVPPRS
mgnify:CR=1 FL=1